MAKTFYTERDIEDLFQRGTRSLTMGEDVVLTNLAYEKAQRLGLVLAQPSEKPPAAPERPYLSQARPSIIQKSAAQQTKLEEIKQRVRQAVLAKMGNSVDPALLDKIIERVAQDIGLR